jgi:hypothetical protein
MKHDSRFNIIANLNDRQLKSFDYMYQRPTEFSAADIHERLKLSPQNQVILAKQRNLPLRQKGGQPR